MTCDSWHDLEKIVAGLENNKLPPDSVKDDIKKFLGNHMRSIRIQILLQLTAFIVNAFEVVAKGLRKTAYFRPMEVFWKRDHDSRLICASLS